MKRILPPLAALCFLIVFALLPLPVPPYLDFQVGYHADMGLLRGIPVYDHAGQVELIAQLADVPPEQVLILPFPYPPWVALALLPLALLPIQIAARIWFEINLLMLVLSIGLMTDGWRTRERVWTGLAAIFFLPVLGTLFVGQYIIPVLLGAALWVYAVRRGRAVLTAAASVLLIFKPHLGALILLAGLYYLWRRRDDFGRRALTYTLLAGSILFALSFLADRGWPLDYPRSLLIFRQDSRVASCGLCASLPVMLAGLVGGAAGLAPILGLVILLVLSLGWGWTRRPVLQHPVYLIAVSVLVILLASPYLLNYDFALLLLPFFLLAGLNRVPVNGFILIFAYFVPLIAIGLWGRQGNFSLPLSAILLLLVLYRDTDSLDGLPRAA